MRVTSLASGSSGNATLIEAGDARILVDAGLSAQLLTTRLRAAGCDPATLTGIALTHEHQDHVAGALTLAERYRLPLMADARTLAALFASPAHQFTEPRVTVDEPIQIAIDPHPVGTTWTHLGLTISSFPIPHDAAAPCGYLIATSAWRVGILTDCGALDDTILRALRPAHLLILEANHDRERLIKGPYPAHLKRRILGPTGHLANHETAEGVHHLLDDGPRWLWLVHLSKTNNTPELARAAITTRLGARRMRAVRLAVAPPTSGPCWDSARLFA